MLSTSLSSSLVTSQPHRQPLQLEPEPQGWLRLLTLPSSWDALARASRYCCVSCTFLGLLLAPRSCLLRIRPCPEMLSAARSSSRSPRGTAAGLSAGSSCKWRLCRILFWEAQIIASHVFTAVYTLVTSKQQPSRAHFHSPWLGWAPAFRPIPADAGFNTNQNKQLFCKF